VLPRRLCLPAAQSKPPSFKIGYRELPTAKNARIALRLIEAVDETLDMLGKQTKTEVYACLERRFGLPKNEIPDKPNVLSDGLSSLFGSASQYLELRILKRFYEKLDTKFEPGGTSTFADHISILQNVK